MIVDVEATTAVRQVEVTAQRIMLDRTQKRFGLWPERLAADSGYGDATNPAWLVHARHRAAHTGIREEPHLWHQQLRVDQRPARLAVVGPQVLSDAAQIDEPADRPQQVIHRQILLEPEAVE
jgi:hypothetical protein